MVTLARDGPALSGQQVLTRRPTLVPGSIPTRLFHVKHPGASVRHGIVPEATPRPASTEPFRREPDAPHCAVPAQCFLAIPRAAGLEPTVPHEKGRQSHLVHADGADQHPPHVAAPSASSPAFRQTFVTSSRSAGAPSVRAGCFPITTTSYPSRSSRRRSTSRRRRRTRFLITARLSRRLPTANPTRVGPSPRSRILSETVRPPTNVPDKNTCSKSARRRSGSTARPPPRRPSAASGPSHAAPSVSPDPSATPSAGESRDGGGVGGGAVDTFSSATRPVSSAH